MASTAGILSRVINTATLGAGVRSDLLRALQLSSAELETISSHARALLIVEPFSAILGIPNERAIPLNADHRDIARLSPRKSHAYLPVWSSVKELVDASRPNTHFPTKELLDTLFCVDYKAAQLRSRQPHRGTCDWVFGNRAYNSWMYSDKSAMLVLSGQAGVGKTVLTRFISETIMAGGESDASDIGYLGAAFYCSYYDEASNKHSEKNVLRSLLHQLIQLNPHCGGVVRNRLEKRDFHGVTIQLLPEYLWMALEDVLAMDTMRKTFIAVDAIEELGIEEATSILAHLWRIVSQINSTRPQSRLRILISNRPHPEYSLVIPVVTILRLPKSEIQASIGRFISDNVEDFAAQNEGFRSSTDPSTRRLLAEKIANRADGMFLWAVVAWDDFKRGLLWNRNVVATKIKRLDSISSGLSALYSKMLDRIDESIREEAISIFATLAVAARPLNETELGVILGISSTENTVTRSSDFDPFLNLGTIIEKNMPELVTIHDDNTITFAHMSFKEHIVEKWGRESPQTLTRARRTIARACLKYIKLRDLLQDAGGNLDRSELAAKYPFMIYATKFYLHHLRFIPYDDGLWYLFANAGGRSSIFTLKVLWPDRHISPETPLMTVIDLDPPVNERLVRQFVEDGYDVDEKWLPTSSESRGPSLTRCCESVGYNTERKKMAFLLLRLGADPSLPEGASSKNIGFAVRARAWDLYEALVHHPKTDLNSGDARGRRVLHHLVESAPTEVLSNFIDRHDSIDINPQDSDKFTPLHLATSHRKLAAVSKLVQTPGIRLDLQDKEGRTPLTLATYWGYKDVALVLCQHSQAFAVPDREVLSPIVYSAKHGQLDLCRQLLRRSGYRNLAFHIDLSGRSILHHAAANDWPDVIDECLRLGGNGVNINQIDHSGGSALHVACALGNVFSVATLLRHGASVRLQDRLGRTAAIAAADAGFKDVLVRLLEVGAVDARQRDFEGRSLVHWVATLDCVDVMAAVMRLPEVDIARRDRHGKMPIDIAATCRCRDVGRYLLRAMQEKRVDGFFDIYNWRDMYNSPEVEAADYEEEESREHAERLHRAAEQAAHEVWEELHQRYPDEHWGLVHMPEPVMQGGPS